MDGFENNWAQMFPLIRLSVRQTNPIENVQGVEVWSNLEVKG